MSIINTQPPKGEKNPTTLQTKGDVETTQFVEGQLEELTEEYNFTKPKYMLEETTEADQQKELFR